MSTPTKLITYEDSLTMPENDFEEIIHGESRIMPPPTFQHARLVRKLTQLLQAQLDPLVYSFLGQDVGLGVKRNPLTCCVPDLMVYREDSLMRGRAQVDRNDPYIWTPPELLVECLSPANRKGLIRALLDDYAQAAVPEVWLLDPAQPQFTSYRFESGQLCEYETKDHGIVTPLLLPNVTLDLVDLWNAFGGAI